jgi:hypothetical protein
LGKRQGFPVLELADGEPRDEENVNGLVDFVKPNQLCYRTPVYPQQ